MDAALADLAAYWTDLLSIYCLVSSDEKLDRMVNIWHQYQCMVTFNMSRSASYFESGTGRGMGFRDSCQDLLGFVHMAPERARERIIDIAFVQWEDGSTYHQYQPLTKRGNNDVGSGFNDDPLWLIACTYAYISETGEWFLRAYDSYSNPVGSHLCEEGQIFIEPQGMCVIAGVGLRDGMAERALDSVRERLLGKHGVELPR